MRSWCLHLHPASLMINPHLPATSSCSLNLSEGGWGCSQQHLGSSLCCRWVSHVLGCHQHIPADHSCWDYAAAPTWVPVLTNPKSGGRCRGCRAGSLFLQPWEPSIRSVPGFHTLFAAFSEPCLPLKYPHLPQSSLKWCFMVHVLLSGLWPSRTPSP